MIRGELTRAADNPETTATGAAEGALVEPGHVYILLNASLPSGVMKIGMTTRTPEQRAKELSGSSGLPAEYQVAYEEEIPDCRLCEALIHERLRDFRVNEDREFFKLPLKEAIEAVADVAEALRGTGLNVGFRSLELRVGGEAPPFREQRVILTGRGAVTWKTDGAMTREWRVGREDLSEIEGVLRRLRGSAGHYRCNVIDASSLHLRVEYPDGSDFEVSVGSSVGHELGWRERADDTDVDPLLERLYALCWQPPEEGSK